MGGHRETRQKLSDLESLRGTTMRDKTGGASGVLSVCKGDSLSRYSDTNEAAHAR